MMGTSYLIKNHLTLALPLMAVRMCRVLEKPGTGGMKLYWNSNSLQINHPADRREGEVLELIVYQPPRPSLALLN